MRHRRMPRKSNRRATCLETFGRSRKTFFLQTHSTSSKSETYFELLEHSQVCIFVLFLGWLAPKLFFFAPRILYKQMKLHSTKDLLAVLAAIVGIVCLSIDKCYADMKQRYYIFFLTTVLVVDSIFVFNKNAYEIDFGKNSMTFSLAVVYIIAFVMIFHYIFSCM